MNDPTTTRLVLPVLRVPGVVFPQTVATLALDTDEARLAISAAVGSGGQVLLLPEVAGRTAAVGVIARVPQSGEFPNGAAAAIIQGEQRALVLDDVPSDRGGRWVAVEPVTDRRPTPRLEAATRELRVVVEDIAELRRSRRLPEILRVADSPGSLADAVTAWSDASDDHKLSVLDATEVGVRVELVLDWAKDFLAELRVNESIRQDVNEGMEKQQREYVLRRQLDAIRKELGEGDDSIVAEYQRKAADADLPDPVRAAVHKEIDRLERAGQQSPEHGWIRSWLDRVLDLPWNTRTEDNLDLTAARGILDADHAGLGDVKDRIVEFLAVRKLRHERGLDTTKETSDRGLSMITTLVGPPGVGKTSLGESVARAMGRNFTRVSLGGVRDEAEIRGHRRTYVGSQPGRIVRAITEAGSMNPVVLLDEVDKLSAGGWSGDPTAALLEVLDPAQNHTFRDHYLEVELDLSDVVFIATANVLDTIPGPLLDRMEIIRLDGYTEDEKVFIARHHLLPRQLERNGLTLDDVIVEDATIRAIVTGYTREAGVRSLERELGKLLRKTAARIATGTSADRPVTIAADDVRGLLGRPKVDDEVAERVTTPGVATGLAVTGTGGDVLFIEAAATTNEAADDHTGHLGGLTLTGQLGDVMKESAQIALSYVRSHADHLGVTAAALQRHVHVHVPAGAVPKDGPSAGITMATAFVSLLTGRAVKPTIGMTGEITLQGKVLPIGGVKQKVLAAHRAGLTEVVLPKRNGPDLEDVPESVRDVMTFHLADTFADVVAAAFAA